jgi:hypothetical protein
MAKTIPFFAKVDGGLKFTHPQAKESSIKPVKNAVITAKIKSRLRFKPLFLFVRMVSCLY